MSIYVDSVFGIRIPKNELAVVAVDVVPTLLFLEGTNYFNVMVHYRADLDGKVGDRIPELHENASYLIVKRPKAQIADVFMSFKQPEYITWARQVERYAYRAGLRPYIVINNPEPGSVQWNRIEDAIKRSKRAFVIWGSRTEWGTGVQREVELCRKHGVPEILLLQRDMDIPNLFKGTDREYQRFDPDNPGEAFATAVESVRQQLLR